MTRIAILISGRGSNMEALLAARLEGTVSVVVSNVPGAGGLEIARKRGVPTAVVDHRTHAGREEFEAALTQELGRANADLVVLAGFMRVLTPAFVARHAGRLMNIHPSLLPAFPGLHTHRRALEAGARIHGCTVHFVTPALDQGPIVAQAAVPVLPGDTEDTLASRVLEQEHRIYPQAVRWFCEGRISFTPDGRVAIRDARPGSGALASPAPES
jgi:phosphoribosylglycinamide formyltransferase-1